MTVQHRCSKISSGSTSRKALRFIPTNLLRTSGSSEFAHEAVNHSETYVRYADDGPVHTNGVENVWSLFKRGIMGVFHKVSAKYLPLYLNEFEFRFNNRDEFNMMDRVLATCF